MTDYILNLIQKYHSRGVLVDTNILLLCFVGDFDRDLIPRFKRTKQFVVEDYILPKNFLARFNSSIITTPHILAEVNSLSGQLGEPGRTAYFEIFSRGIGLLDEQYVESKTAAEFDRFPTLGLTDSGVAILAKGAYLVLTDDSKLYRTLETMGIDVMNFNHIRPIGWTR